MWRSKDDHWRILDIRIDHVSLVMAYRLQYDPMVKAKGLEALIHRLETKIEDC
jgi:ABC-type transporter MlaC component|tara:strand:- start:28 stop:186 length:159 start_codon:yes stop_codon:yes gene_type:complete